MSLAFLITVILIVYGILGMVTSSLKDDTKAAIVSFAVTAAGIILLYWQR